MPANRKRVHISIADRLQLLSSTTTVVFRAGLNPGSELLNELKVSRRQSPSVAEICFLSRSFANWSMGKPAESSPRLRCVHCGNTETPLWRGGPDGPKTLCNACGVRYKKGKLVLYKGATGKLTAVRGDNEAQVQLLPTPKKPNKKATPTQPELSPSLIASFSAESGSRRIIRKVPSEGAISVALTKPTTRCRRANAGQMPGRYASKTLPEVLAQWPSPFSSPQSSPWSPAESPRVRGTCMQTLAWRRFRLDLGSPILS